MYPKVSIESPSPTAVDQRQCGPNVIRDEKTNAGSGLLTLMVQIF